MKIFIIVLITLMLLTGCDKKEESKKSTIPQNDNTSFVLKKNDEVKDYVYYNLYREIIGYDDNAYKLEIPVINVDSDDIDNVNLELRNFVISSFKNMQITNNVFSGGNVIKNNYYITDKYVTVIQRYQLYVDGQLGEEKDNVYVVSLNDGKVASNKELLDNYGFSEDALYKLLEEKIDSDDVLYSLMNIKNNGYTLYVNNDSKLCIIYYEHNDLEEIRKELVLN